MDHERLITLIDNLVRPSDKRNRIVAIWTVVFLTAAHAFRRFNTAFNHDSLKVFQSDYSWQAYLGRYLVPTYLMFRGKIGVPFLIALITSIFLVVVNVLMVRVLRIKKPIHVILFCGLTATTPVIISLFSTFITATDIHVLALVFATLSVYFLLEYQWGLVLGGLFLACSLVLIFISGVSIKRKCASESYSKMDEVLSMPSFPSPGCVRMIGDVIVVRLSQE